MDQAILAAKALFSIGSVFLIPIAIGGLMLVYAKYEQRMLEGGAKR